MKSSPVRHPNRKVSEVMEYHVLSERLRKTLYYGILPKQDRPSLALTSVIMGRFKEQDDDTLFLEKLRFEYASELSREACISPCSLVLAMIYLDRLTKNNPNYISSIPSSKLFLVSVMIASKFLNDEGEEDEVFNHEWANCANIPLSELNLLEREFLTAIDWALFVNEEDFEAALFEIEYKVARNESLKRGWMTYTDLNILAQTQLLVDTWELMVSHVINVSVACTAAYLASLVTLVGSALVVSSLPWNTCSHQSSSGLSVDSNNLATTGRLSPITEYGKGSPQTLDVELDLDAETEVLLDNLTRFSILVRDAVVSPEVRSHCNGPYWQCKPEVTLTYKPPPLVSGRQMGEINSTELQRGTLGLCSRMYSTFRVPDGPITFRTLASCAAA